MWERLRRDRSGFTLMELLIGLAVAALVLGAVTDLQLRAYRYRLSDEARLADANQSAIALDWISRDGRQASGATLTAGGLSLSLQSGTVHYRFDPVTGEVWREAPTGAAVVARRVEGLAFAMEQSDSVLRVDLTAAGTGPNRRLTGRVALRNKS